MATGRRAGRRTLRVGDRIDPEALPVLQGERCASVDGVSLHANVAVPARDRKRLERLARYVARPPVSTDRLSRLEDGRLLYRLKHRWRDGTTHVVFEPRELVEKLAALVPPPRLHLVRYHGILGPSASERDRIVPEPCEARAGPALSDRCAHAGREQGEPIASRLPHNGATSERGVTARREPGPPDPGERPPALSAAPSAASRPRLRRLAWADLLRRVFAIDVLRCPGCGGRMRILAAIHPPESIAAILECLGLPVRAPPISPARPEDAGAAERWAEFVDAPPDDFGA